MNFCTRCASYYMQPGTCNCYALPRLYPAPADSSVVYPGTAIPITVGRPQTGTVEGPAVLIDGTRE